MRLFTTWVVLALLFAGSFVAKAEYKGEPLPQVPAKGMVTMVDLGAHKCIPCKMMAPILEKLKKQYHGKASIIFIDVWEHREQASRFGIRAIPTQIFFDKDGREVYRHVGFMAEDAIVRQLEELGVPQAGNQEEKKG